METLTDNSLHIFRLPLHIDPLYAPSSFCFRGRFVTIIAAALGFSVLWFLVVLANGEAPISEEER